MTRYWAAAAHLPDGLAADVTFEIADGRFTAVTPGTAPGDARRLPGVVLPGFANAHSHAFHRALRGRTHGGGGTFWTWREAMYAVAARLDPDSYLALAPAAYAEMALAGVTAVGEFHYLHHGPGGVPYADPNAMRAALRAAAADAGIRLTLLDTCYLAGGFDTPLEGPQLRFGDRDVARLGRAGRGRRRRGRATRCGRCPATRSPSSPGRRGPSPARAPVRAARRERGVPRPPRAHADRPARRRGRARAGHDRRARHPPDRRRHRAARRLRHRGVPVPDHRARPRRRHRPGPRARRRRARRCRSAATSTPSSTCSRRPGRWSCTSGSPPASAAGSARPSCSPR